MAKKDNMNDTTFNMKLPTSLREQFYAAAEANDQSAAQLIRAFMREYINNNKQGNLLSDDKKRK